MEKIKEYSLSLTVNVPPKDKEKHRRDAEKISKLKYIN